MATAVDVRGAEEAFREVGILLSGLSGRAVRQVLRPAHRAAARVVVRAAEGTSRFQDRSGRLRESIRVATARRGRLSIVRVVAGDYGEAGSAPHAHLIERGTKRGLRARLFLETAAEESQSGALIAAARSGRRSLRRLERRGG